MLHRACNNNILHMYLACIFRMEDKLLFLFDNISRILDQSLNQPVNEHSKKRYSVILEFDKAYPKKGSENHENSEKNS